MVPSTYLRPAGKPVARVNGVVLTDVDLVREEYAIFPYAAQHGGKIPADMEPGIRKGAMQMIIFEELVYQDAQKRGITDVAGTAQARPKLISAAIREPRRVSAIPSVRVPGQRESVCAKRSSARCSSTSF